MTSHYLAPRLGILGGGQLGRMLLREAQRLDVTTWVLDPDPAAPALVAAHHPTLGHYQDPHAVLNLGRQVQVLTVEIEHVHVGALAELQRQGVRVHPSAEVLSLVQDKGLQKQFYRQHGIPTAPFRLLDDDAHLHREPPEHYPSVIKLRRAGYDGRGVLKLQSPADLARAWQEPLVLEHYAPLAAEVAVLVARTAQGQLATYPAVEMLFHPTQHLVEMLATPAQLPPEALAQADALARRVAEALGVVGLLAVEMFYLTDGTWWVNEVAPRPHNSGHMTWEANDTSQFEQHLRCVLGLPLGSTSLRCPAAMINLLGAEGHEGPVVYDGLAEAMALPGVHVHLYGKATTRPFRKMGHITVTAPTHAQAVATARQLQQLVQVVSS